MKQWRRLTRELFQQRIIYGLIYLELTYEHNRLLRQGKEFTLSPYLKRRFTFHLMMQSLIALLPKGRKP